MAAWELTGLKQQSPNWNPGGVYNPRVGDTVRFRMLPLGDPANPTGVLLPEYRKLLYHSWQVVRPDGTVAPFRYKPLTAKDGRGTDHYIYVLVNQAGDWTVTSQCWKNQLHIFSVGKVYTVRKKA